MRIRKVNYFYVTIREERGAAYELLARLASSNVNLLAFVAVPFGPNVAQLTLFPESDEALASAARNSGFTLEGPHPALLVQGDDALGALAEIHQKLADAQVDVFASSGVTSHSGNFGYVIYVTPDQVDRAIATLT